MRRTLLLLLCLAGTGCERPFIEPEPPRVELVSPADLSTVRTERVLPLAFRASTAFGAVTRVEVNGEAATFVADEGLYLDTLRLEEGLNAIGVEAFGEGGVVGADTLFALYLPAEFARTTARFPDAVGGHTTTRLRDGRILLAGGTGAATEPARDAALTLDPGTLSFRAVSARMIEPRLGHAAALLPDGRVLLTGGSRRLHPEGLDDLAPGAEVFDPVSNTFRAVPVVAEDGGTVAPVLRTEHTLTVIEGSGRTAVYLYGGLGNVGSATDPVFAESPFLRALWLEEGPDGLRLVAPDRTEGFRFEPIARHTMTPLRMGPGGFGRYLIAGVTRSGGPPFTLEFAPSQVEAQPVSPLAEARADHAAAMLHPGLVLVSGGRTPDLTEALDSGEIFAEAAGVFFRLPADVRLGTPRWGHTATNLGDGRILLAGGFSSSGQAYSPIELFQSAP